MGIKARDSAGLWRLSAGIGTFRKQAWKWYILEGFLQLLAYMHTRVFQMWHFVKKKNCDASTIPSRAYINHIQKNFFPRTSLEGRPTWSKIGHPGVSICRKNLFFNNNTTPVNSLRGSQERLQHFFCSNTLPFFATDTYKLVAQGSLFIWVYSDYLSFSI